MKFLNWFDINFWSIIIWVSLIIIFGGWLGLLQLTEAERLYYGLGAMISLATSDILRKVTHGSAKL